MSLKDFQLLQKLGEGAYSTVYKVKRLIDNQQYAMKKVKMDFLTEKQKENALNEVRILASINHPNIISYKEAFIEKGSNALFIVMEYADGGDLLQEIKQRSKTQSYFAQREVWSIFIQVTQGLKALHDIKILHRDIKSANVFLFQNGMVKLGDLNVSKFTRSPCETQTGTPYYASPQIWKQQPYDKKSDIWSLGCVFYELLCLKPPFRANDMEGLYKKVIRGFYSRLPPEYSNDLNVILKLLLQVTPHLRSTCDKILQHPIVLKHIECLPDESNFGPSVQTQLMKTIKIEVKQKQKDLTKKVKLPKSRYSNTIDNSNVNNLKRNISKLSNVNEMDISFQVRSGSKDKKQKNQIMKQNLNSERYSKQGEENDDSLQKGIILPSDLLVKRPTYSQKKKGTVLPKIGRGLQTLDIDSQVKSNKNSELIRKIELKSYDQSSQLKNKSLVILQNRKSNKSPKAIQFQNSQKMLQGRLKQISPDILAKILKKEKQRSKIYSIVGSK